MSHLKNMGIPSAFYWKGLGNLDKGRVSLGKNMPVMIYRLFQYSLKDVLNREFGKQYAAALYCEAGHMAGMEFAEHTLDLSGDFDFFIGNLIYTLREYKFGILQMEKVDINNLAFILTISEDLDCSGLPVTDETVCDYDEGFISGIFEAYTGHQFTVKEVDCWASGARTCRFSVVANTL